MKNRLLAATLGQGLSSLGNFIVLFAALRTLPLSELGTFTILYNGGILLLGLVRPLALEPLIVRFTEVASSGKERRLVIGQVTGFSLAVGLLTIVSAAALSKATNGFYLILAIALTLLLVHDAWRFCAFAQRTPWTAAGIDAVSVLFAIGAVGFTRNHEASIETILAIWAALGAGGTIAGLIIFGVLPRPALAFRWLSRCKGLGYGFLGEVVAERAAFQLALLIVGAIAGSAAIGSVGAARTLMTPVTTVISSAIVFAIPEATRLKEQGRYNELKKLSHRISLVLAVVTALFVAGVLALPDRLGELLAGTNWTAASPLVLPIGIWTAAVAARNGPRAFLRSLGESRLMFRLSLEGSLLLLLLVTVGTVLGGAAGAGWGLAMLAVSTYFLWKVAQRGSLARELERLNLNL